MRTKYALYRPFLKKYLYFAELAIDELGQIPRIFPTFSSEFENRILCVGGYGRKEFAVFLTNLIPGPESLC